MAESTACTYARSRSTPTATRNLAQDGRYYRTSTSNAKSVRKPWALSVVQSGNGILLVDEIDTGLHHTVMEDMWRFLYECSKRYNVQIIATTHSWDCYHSLAVICRDYISDGSDVTISRIERGREEAVSYTEQEIVAVADRDIEVR